MAGGLGLFSGAAPAPARGAALSDCGLYRYRLWRRWAAGDDCCWVMLNPSRADAETEDPTVRKVSEFSRRWGFGGLVIVNLFAWRATEPQAMLAAADPVGPENDRHLLDATREAGRVVCAWGLSGRKPGQARAREVLRLLDGLPLWALTVTADGTPGHPLFVRGDTEPLLLARP